MRNRGIGEDDYAVLAATPRDVPTYLSAADAGLAFIKPCFSKLASSPTKYAEYLGCGLPLIINSGIGDSDRLIAQKSVGALVSEFDDDAYAQAATTIEGFTSDLDETRRRARAVAEKLFDLKHVGMRRYAQLYERVLTAEPRER
jgi:glycosyltransferase involved in cell wall biosynthesis